MIDAKDLKTNPEKYLAALQRRGPKFDHLADRVRAFVGGASSGDQQRYEELRAKIHEASALIPTLTPAQKKKKIAEMKIISDEAAALKSTMGAADTIVAELPNLPKDDVPDGHDERANQVMRVVGFARDLKHPRDYLALNERLGVIDIPRAAKVSGSRFGYIVGPLAQLWFACVQHAQRLIIKKGFTMIIPPVMIKEENMAAMGYLAGGGESETYHLPDDHLYLVGTSEQSVGPMHRDEIFSEAEIPRRYVSYSTCFRREAGSYGKDTKGIIRVHQFDKLEMFSFCHPDHSDQEHELLLAREEELMRSLDLPYRVVKLCAGDLSYASARTYDIETWLPGHGVYRETHSASTTTDYQARALNIKVKTPGGPVYAHLLNATAVTPRLLMAIMENYQRPDGRIDIPHALRPYMGGLKVIG